MIDIELMDKLNSEPYEELEKYFPYSYAKKNLQTFVKLRDMKTKFTLPYYNKMFAIDSRFASGVDGMLLWIFAKETEGHSYYDKNLVEYGIKSDMRGYYTIIPKKITTYDSIMNRVFMLSLTDERAKRINTNLWRRKSTLIPSKEMFDLGINKVGALDERMASYLYYETGYNEEVSKIAHEYFIKAHKAFGMTRDYEIKSKSLLARFSGTSKVFIYGFYEGGAKYQFDVPEDYGEVYLNDGEFEITLNLKAGEYEIYDIPKRMLHRGFPVLKKMKFEKEESE
ncbi:MAG: hypothetical protein QXL94_04385 [Candidatus Parvarchaeum sp.]